jgi:Methyltransferase domain
MSVDRLAGSGTAGGDTEPARRRRAQRRRTGRRPDTGTSTRGVAEPGQAGEATASPESNVILLGQETGSGASATTEAAAAEAAAPGTAATTGAATTGAATTGAATTGAAAPDTAATAETAPSGTAATTEAPPASDRVPRSAPANVGLFARYIRDYVTGHDGHQIMILQAGCTTADGDLGVGVLREAGADIVVSLIDDDQPVTRAALRMDENLAGCVQGDLRTVPLPPRSHDIVLCALLLQRINHAELVLDRLVAAIRPGGLLLLRFSDRDSSGGFLDRVMPLAARSAVWRRRRPGRPGPYPAVYERLSSVQGVQAYALMRELVIAERQALGGLAGALAEPRGFLAAHKLAAWLSRGRLTAAHEELLYVLRKPEDRFARIL